MKIASRFYALYRNGETVTNISDSEDILKQLITSDADVIKELKDPSSDFMPSDIKTCESFDIIENSPSKEYGYTEVVHEYEQDENDRITDSLEISIYHDRFTVDDDYFRAVFNLRNASPNDYAEIGHADHTNTITSAVNKAIAMHCRFWKRNTDADTVRLAKNLPVIYYLSDEYKTMLLKTGFKSDMVIISS